jgi:RNA polymerase sigma-70 factor (ECF subfamily)
MDHSGASGSGTANSPRLAAAPLEAIFARCQDELLGMLYYLLGNVEDARDALQEAFVKCWQHREQLLGIENLRGWVFRVAMNAGRDLRNAAWRRYRRRLNDGEKLPMTIGRSVEGEAVHREQLTLLHDALLRLRQEEREVFLLRQNGQMTYEEIAQTLQVPVGTVKTRMRLALERLRQSLEGK